MNTTATSTIVWIASLDLQDETLTVVGNSEEAARAALVDVLEAYGFEADEALMEASAADVIDRPICVPA